MDIQNDAQYIEEAKRWFLFMKRGLNKNEIEHKLSKYEKKKFIETGKYHEIIDWKNSNENEIKFTEQWLM